MSKLMTVLGIVLLAVGVALALVGLVNPAQILVYGLSLESALNLIVGGILAIGLGGVIQALGQGSTVVEMVQAESSAPAEVVASPEPEPIPAEAAAETVEHAVEEKKPSGGFKFPGFGRKVSVPAVSDVAPLVTGTAAAAGAAAAATAASAAEATSSSVQDTISALEQARSDIEMALGGKAMSPVEDVAAAIEEEDVAEAEEAELEAEGDELYVVEDRIIRGRPARLLSDGTVEAETEEGWMRFENLEHLDEYLDAVDAG
jgi:hypothetical protein